MQIYICSGGPDEYYPDYNLPWDQAYCINKRPVPSGRGTYSSMLACCKQAYAGQVSGKLYKGRVAKEMS